MEIQFRAVMEVLGKPQEHVGEMMKKYVDNIKKSEIYTVVHEEYADIKKQENHDMWTTFAELEIKTSSIENLVGFCFDFMPSIIEIISPKELPLKDNDLNMFLNDLQARLHSVDMIAKQVQIENKVMQENMAHLLKNYVTVLLKNRDLTAEELSKLTGIDSARLGDFLDQLLDQGKIDLKGEKYSLL